jgi:hypothetical protein
VLNPLKAAGFEAACNKRAIANPQEGSGVVLFRSGRRRQEEIAEREAAGENLWTTDFSREVRVKIKLAAADTIGSYAGNDVYTYAHGLLARAHGQEKFTTRATNQTSDLIGTLTLGDDEIVPDVVESLYEAIRHFTRDFVGFAQVPIAGPDYFAEQVNRILREERVAFELIEGRMVDLSSEELHVNVVSKSLRLLSGRPGFDKVEVAYQNAILEISNGNPDDAITDAGTALQETLTALGCSGSSLGPLIKNARQKGLLAPHDAKLDRAITDVMEWVSADRSESGEAHHVSDASVEDAWLMVHVVGALILRLASGDARSTIISR